MTCPRCFGRGRAPLKVRYTYVHFGECRLCFGIGYAELGGES